jgi:hypothetical protein
MEAFFALDLKDILMFSFADKVWIQHDGTEEGIANDLVAEGIPKSHIILGFKSPEVRKYTKFAVS